MVIRSKLASDRGIQYQNIIPFICMYGRLLYASYSKPKPPSLKFRVQVDKRSDPQSSIDPSPLRIIGVV